MTPAGDREAFSTMDSFNGTLSDMDPDEFQGNLALPFDGPENPDATSSDDITDDDEWEEEVDELKESAIRKLVLCNVSLQL